MTPPHERAPGGEPGAGHSTSGTNPTVTAASDAEPRLTPGDTTIGAVTVTATANGVKSVRVRTVHGEELRLCMWQRADEPVPMLWIQVYGDPDDPDPTGPLDGDENYALDPQAALDLSMWLGAIGSSLQVKWDAVGVAGVSWEIR